MQYLGSKKRLAKYYAPIFEANRTLNQWYIEPMTGGANMIEAMSGNRAGFDSNKYLIALLKHVAESGELPENIPEDLYLQIKNNKDSYPDYLVGFVGFLCSFGSKWFGGYARNKKGDNYAGMANRSLKKQSEKIKNIHFETKKFQDLKLFEPCLIYCDPPYEGTTKYKDDFPHSEFWEWCRSMVKDRHKVFVSEYNAPEDFICIFSTTLNNHLNINIKQPEKLFIHESQLNNIIIP